MKCCEYEPSILYGLQESAMATALLGFKFYCPVEMLQLVEQLTNDPKFKGLNPAPAAATGEIKFLDF